MLSDASPPTFRVYIPGGALVPITFHPQDLSDIRESLLLRYEEEEDAEENVEAWRYLEDKGHPVIEKQEYAVYYYAYAGYSRVVEAFSEEHAREIAENLEIDYDLVDVHIEGIDYIEEY